MKKKINEFDTYRKVKITKDINTKNVINIEEEFYVENGKKYKKEYRLTGINALEYNRSEFKDGSALEVFMTDEEIGKLKKDNGIVSTDVSIVEKLKKENEELKKEILKEDKKINEPKIK